MTNRSNRLIDVCLALGVLLALAIVAAGVYLGTKQQTWSVLAIGVASLAAVLVGGAIAKAVDGARSAYSTGADQKFATISDRLEQFSVILTLMSEQQLLSDRAKTVVVPREGT